jgi:hypothetical protein
LPYQPNVDYLSEFHEESLGFVPPTFHGKISEI